MFDVAVIGAGAAGMMCAALAGQRGRRVVLIDHATKLAEKIRISGGGRCNFTNKDAGPANYVSANPHFCRSALSRYTPADFLALMARYRLGWHEKHRGQLFCDESSDAIIRMLKSECDIGHVEWRMPCSVESVVQQENGFLLQTSSGPIRAKSLVIATGGLSIPAIGATDFGFKLARQFGLKIIEPRPALVPLTFDSASWTPFAPLAGVALEVDIRTGAGKTGMHFKEDLLFTHRGLSGPAVLQISTYWNPGQPIQINLLPGVNLAEALLTAKPGNRQQVGSVLAGLLPRRLAEQWLSADVAGVGADFAAQRIADVSDKSLRKLADSLQNWQVVPSGTEGYKKAEVTRGGVDTKALDQQTMAARSVPGLHFIGESVDVTGWLGGYNFQWAWASASACAQAV
ncbi:NAD(P)/FAD-dependent oxidoreductase [Pigmentiphaga aceris]|uniref:NAD(P)/FAD-dependent oxidoreductase n=1 Tax=Pigmentiphaga aceris TaxID=1940612 RepID=A0A5C0B208_9BURK|nr:NAD(P)/FAD-dependent oxidoreductase [Pigmentiphaga aceris]QEI08325.1 NAD(P)/FAD-dependent oxidoreductase [Pigmentiphaga aceris]